MQAKMYEVFATVIRSTAPKFLTLVKIFCRNVAFRCGRQYANHFVVFNLSNPTNLIVCDTPIFSNLSNSESILKSVIGGHF